jgi:hypothetical protein
MAGAAYVVFAVSCGIGTGLIGRMKGSSFLLWFLLGTLFPILGVVIALLYRVESNELRRQCPNCGRVTKLYDAICTRCGHELDFPDVAIEPENLAAER